MEQKAFLDALIDRLTAIGFDVSGNRRASGLSSYASLEPEYLCVAKYHHYSPMSVIGAIEEIVLVAADKRVDEEAMRLLAGRAYVDAQSRRQRFHKIFPVIYQYIFPVILIEQALPGMAEHFQNNSAALDNMAIIYPVVCNQATGAIEYYRKVPFFGNAHFGPCQKRVEQMFLW